MEPMLGMVFMVPWSWAPQDYVRCNGQQMNLQQYAAVYSLIGTVYGGNGSTTFNVPNLQCRMPMGYGQGTIGNSVGVLNIGQLGGSFISTLNQANIPLHTHTSTFAPTVGNQPITIPATTGNLSVGVTFSANTNTTALNIPGSPNTWLGAPSSTGVKMYAPAGGTEVPLSGVTTTVTGTAGTAATTATISSVTGGSVAVGPNVGGGGTPFGTVSPYLALNFIIAMNGLYPMRN